VDSGSYWVKLSDLQQNVRLLLIKEKLIPLIPCSCLSLQDINIVHTHIHAYNFKFQFLSITYRITVRAEISSISSTWADIQISELRRSLIAGSVKNISSLHQ
jgi:hypothetical protein